MISLLQNTQLSFKADYSQRALQARQPLRVEWIKGNFPSDACLQDIKDHKYEILYDINTSIIKLPSSFAEAVAALSTRHRPKLISAKKWNQILASLSGLLKDDAYWLCQIIHHSWDITDIFGCHAANPENRIDAMGLLLLLHGREIVGVSREGIALKTRSGAAQTYRRPLLTPLGQTTLDLLP